ncbi:MAG: hypothetical protein WCH60_07075 [Burkholderiales bacterium]
MENSPEPSSDPNPDGRAASLVTELNNMRDALVRLSLLMRDYLCDLDSARRNQVISEADQAIERAKAMACQPPRRQ